MLGTLLLFMIFMQLLLTSISLFTFHIFKISALMDKFEKQFEDLDVQTGYMEHAMGDTTTLTVPQVWSIVLLQNAQNVIYCFAVSQVFQSSSKFFTLLWFLELFAHFLTSQDYNTNIICNIQYGCISLALWFPMVFVFLRVAIASIKLLLQVTQIKSISIPSCCFAFSFLFLLELFKRRAIVLTWVINICLD